MKQWNVLIVGGDRRTAYLAPCMEMQGFSVSCYGTCDLGFGKKCGKCADSLESGVDCADIIIGGIPLIKEGRIYAQKEGWERDADDFAGILRRGQILFGGMIPGEFRESCGKKRVDCHDFMEEESIALFNAIATAEGAILEAIKNKETNLHGSKTLVLGYGRCARVLSEKLKGLGAKVTVCCRREEALAEAYTKGFEILPLLRLSEESGGFEYIFNTIPASVLQRGILDRMREDVLILDLASGRESVDYEYAGQRKLSAIHCPGLPGKYAAKISAECLSHCVKKILSQKYGKYEKWKEGKI